ncbi:MAG: hypothetical protein GY821_16280 [Gammaproteobacteria bacterium]|nr:hypothetical protein [Gammaproteobacteria bacterium]
MQRNKQDNPIENNQQCKDVAAADADNFMRCYSGVVKEFVVTSIACTAVACACCVLRVSHFRCGSVVVFSADVFFVLAGNLSSF